LSKKVAELGKYMVKNFPLVGDFAERIISYFWEGGWRWGDATLGRQDTQSENGMTFQ
jgi:hypothetical protein